MNLINIHISQFDRHFGYATISITKFTMHTARIRSQEKVPLAFIIICIHCLLNIHTNRDGHYRNQTSIKKCNCVSVFTME